MLDINYLKETLTDIQGKIEYINKAFNRDSLANRVGEIDSLSMSTPDFWSDPASKVLLKEQAAKRKSIEEYDQLIGLLENFEVSIELYLEDPEAMQEELEGIIEKLVSDTERFEMKLMMSEESDISDAILSIHSGAGGTESDDWCSMLYRMYTRWAEKSGFTMDLMDIQMGEEAGVRSVIFEIKGEYAYGRLRSENGVHRLVRLSPFDSANRRHTSFAAVSVLPDIEDTIDIEVSDADVKIDTFKASGSGGQHVNTTDSAVRMTHKETGIVVTCQSERSQHKNRASAMKILKAKLYELEMEKRQSERDLIESSKDEIGWGSQIRSYVMHPYKMVKDQRTKTETGNVDAVMDGDLDQFSFSYLMYMAGKNS